MQFIIGLLNVAYKVVVPGRAFIRRLIDATKRVKKHYLLEFKRIENFTSLTLRYELRRETQEMSPSTIMKLDFEMWLSFLHFLIILMAC